MRCLHHLPHRLRAEFVQDKPRHGSRLRPFHQPFSYLGIESGTCPGLPSSYMASNPRLCLSLLIGKNTTPCMQDIGYKKQSPRSFNRNTYPISCLFFFFSVLFLNVPSIGNPNTISSPRELPDWELGKKKLPQPQKRPATGQTKSRCPWASFAKC